MPKGPSPYKGHPKSEWAAIKAKLDAERATRIETITVGDTVVEFPKAADNSNVIPPNLFTGDNKVLEVMSRDGDIHDPLPGYKGYWFNDTDIRIAKALKSGYQFVERDEVMLSDGLVAGDDVAGNHVRKLVGGQPDGRPLYAYLMKIPNHIKEAHDLEYQKVNERLQNMVDGGRLSRDQMRDRQYSKATDPTSSLPAIERSSKIYR